MEPLSQYSPIKLHLSPATRILSENPVINFIITVMKMKFDGMHFM